MRKTNVWYCSYAESKKNTTNDFIYKTDTDTRTQHTDTAPRGATRPGESHTRTRGHTQTDRQRALAVHTHTCGHTQTDRQRALAVHTHTRGHTQTDRQRALAVHTRTRGHTQTDRQRALAVQRGQPQSAPDDKTTGESLELCA